MAGKTVVRVQHREATPGVDRSLVVGMSGGFIRNTDQ